MREAQVVILRELTGSRNRLQRHIVTDFRNNEPMVETIGTRARKQRKRLGKTLAEIAKAAGISTGFLSDLEHDRSMGTTKLNALAEALELNIDYLESGTGPQGVTERYSAKSAITRVTVHGFNLSVDGCRFAEEWEKLDEPMRSQIVTMVEGLVADQVRRKRRSDKPKLPHVAARSPKLAI